MQTKKAIVNRIDETPSAARKEIESKYFTVKVTL